MTIIEAINNTEKALRPVSGEFAMPEAERILGFLLGMSRPELYFSRGKAIPAGIAGTIDSIIARRLTNEPLPYILGSVYFFHREFMVSPDVLIPRPDTEILVETVLEHERAAVRRFADIGVGSGCIAAILTEIHEGWRCVAVDISGRALAVARRNCGNRVALLQADLLSAFKTMSPFDFIVCNPPYIRSSGLSSLPRSVRDFEPRVALDGGGDGLDFYRILAANAPRLLARGGGIYCEIGYDQGAAVRAIFESLQWRSCAVARDNAGNHRVMQAKI